MNWVLSPTTYRQRQQRQTLARVGSGVALIAGGGLALWFADRYSKPEEGIPVTNSPIGDELPGESAGHPDITTVARDLALAPGVVREVAITTTDAPAGADAEPGAPPNWLVRGAHSPQQATAGQIGWSDFDLSIMGSGFETIGVGSDVRRSGPPTPGGQGSVAVFMGLAGGVIWPNSLFEGMAMTEAAPGDNAGAEAAAPDK